MQKEFGELSVKQAAVVSGALTAAENSYKAPKRITGDAVFKACQTAKLTQDDVVKALEVDVTDEVAAILTTITGSPHEGGTGTKARQKIAQRVGLPKNDPRVIVELKPNPKREGTASHARYQGYDVGMTVEEAKKAGLTSGDIRWDSDESRKHIILAEPDSDEAKKAVAARKRRLAKE